MTLKNYWNNMFLRTCDTFLRPHFITLLSDSPSRCSRTLMSDRTVRRSERLSRFFVSGLRISLDVYFLLIPDANQVKPQREVYRVMQTLSASVSRLHATCCSGAHYSFCVLLMYRETIQQCDNAADIRGSPQVTGPASRRAAPSTVRLISTPSYTHSW